VSDGPVDEMISRRADPTSFGLYGDVTSLLFRVPGLEKNKLFLKDLSKDTTQDKLQKIFEEFGTLKEVRLITYRNGHSKGLAFVEFDDEASAARALVKTDGELSDIVLKVRGILLEIN
jgi:RNA recognition motif-containing protein